MKQFTECLSDLDVTLATAFELLNAAVVNRRCAMHTPVLASIDDDGFPTARTVVLRDFEEVTRTLIANCDRRSPKAKQLENGRAMFVFYDPELRVQIRAAVKVTLHHSNDLAEARWGKTQLMSRRCYLSVAGPSSVSDFPTSGLPEDMLNRTPTEKESLVGMKNFVVISGEIISLDWLLLASGGHRRAKFEWSNHKLQKQWLFP